jgi:hypothetical protein
MIVRDDQQEVRANSLRWARAASANHEIAEKSEADDSAIDRIHANSLSRDRRGLLQNL